jgi:hypothetical protein
MAVEDIDADRPAEIELPDRYRGRRRLASSQAASIWLSVLVYWRTSDRTDTPP